MFLGYHLLAQVSALVFDAFTASNRESVSSSYSKNEVSIGNTKLKLDGDIISISGLSDWEYLLCFREGNLLFPNNPADQHVEHKMQIEEDDFFVWTKLDWQPASFVNDLYAGMTDDQIDMDSVYSFKVTKSVSQLEMVRSKVASWTLNSWLMEHLPFILAATFILILVVTIPLLMIKSQEHSTPTPFDPCSQNDAIYERFIQVRYNSTRLSPSLLLQVHRDIVNVTESVERAIGCLQAEYPDLDPSLWKIYFFDDVTHCVSSYRYYKGRIFCPI